MELMSGASTGSRRASAGAALTPALLQKEEKERTLFASLEHDSNISKQILLDARPIFGLRLQYVFYTFILLLVLGEL